MESTHLGCPHHQHQDPFTRLTEMEFLNVFRLSKSLVCKLLATLDHRELDDDIPVELQVLATLAFLATGQLSSSARLLGTSRWAAIGIVYKVAQVIKICLGQQYLVFPGDEEQTLFREEFYKISLIPGVLACLDGFAVPLCTISGVEVGWSYITRGHSYLGMVVVCGPQQQIIYIIAQERGSSWPMFNESMLRHSLEEDEVEGMIVVLENFPSKPYLLTPAVPTETVEEYFYNHALKQIMIRSAEKTTHSLKTRFPCLKKGMEPLDPSSLPVLVACAILHNLCLKFSCPLPNYSVTPNLGPDHDLGLDGLDPEDFLDQGIYHSPVPCS
ncbi:nuclease HARBI1-like 13 [Homarus americanus]|uniref:Nuclease HARBI1-like 13 n=1 Tax=Homarus americanus TaxID=6706 RepID=A0A8J5MS14_HOMAM|nr:nuclease HARBI1-like 13 [Homarus americanus]